MMALEGTARVKVEIGTETRVLDIPDLVGLPPPASAQQVRDDMTQPDWGWPRLLRGPCILVADA